MINKLLQTRLKRKKRVSAGIIGTIDMPRVSVFRSNKHIFIQAINDDSSSTLVSLSSSIIADNKGKTKTDISRLAGLEFAKIALAKNITKIIFDRGSNAYKGIVKALAECMREGGLEF